ncbi:CHASE2 domain-containing serine/threonine-protein kinase [Acidovorax sp. BL-A-41-H1]|uniref:CHASE2 domain-containing serine/threonine-protein kinase n=1 Tax=Acidovorax sp. BL-A-41-H1 TaxID=3421102 RepID=UPI003F792DE0
MWRTDGFWAGVACAGTLALAVLTGAVQRLEYRFYDAATQSPLSAGASDIAIIAIDEVTVAELGPLPWPREVHARMVERLGAAGARAIVYTPALPEQPAERGLAYIRRMGEVLARSGDGSPLTTELGRLVGEAEAALDGDARLARAIQQAGNVLLASSYAGPATAAPPPAYVLRSALAGPGAPALSAPPAQHPAAALGQAAAGVGHLHPLPDIDGKVRRIHGLLNDHGAGIPSLALLAVQLQMPAGQRSLKSGAPGLQIGSLAVPTDSAFVLRPRMFTGAAAASSAFAMYPFSQVLSGKVPAGVFKGKTVLVGAASPALAPPWQTLDGRPVPPVEMLAHTIWSARQGSLVQHPSWAGKAGWASAIGALLVAVFALPRLSASTAVTVGLALALAIACAEWGLLRYAGTWVPLLPGVAVLLAGTAAVLVHRVLKKRNTVPPARSTGSAETDRMMGLALQGQGQLDMAFERLRKVPMSDALLDNLYHLGQDYERKQNSARAKAVYGLILRHDRDYRDVRSRYKRIRAELQREENPSQTPHASASTPPDNGGLRMPQPAGDAPLAITKLGRYGIERELGNGAMGVVYLGRDPTIGRVVALKTMALGDEFEGTALIDARTRFFREAETAGRLQHPNIVTIFDAGEEHGLAYIAMEFLKGTDLAGACSENALLPVPVVLSIAARVAEALDYAHAHQVVHRDIKPANIMYDAAADTVKVTDFGIARITDSSRTRTGLVLGTPSFMSPEQLAGKKVDGRSDLYALGVTLFQLLSGRLPLRGASMNELMRLIATVEPPDIRQLRADLPASVAQVVAKALRKRPEARYQTGQQLATELRSACADMVAHTAIGGTGPVVYDSARAVTGHEMADYQEAVTETPARRGAEPPPISGTR